MNLAKVWLQLWPPNWKDSGNRLRRPRVLETLPIQLIFNWHKGKQLKRQYRKENSHSIIIRLRGKPHSRKTMGLNSFWSWIWVFKYIHQLFFKLCPKNSIATLERIWSHILFQLLAKIKSYLIAQITHFFLLHVWDSNRYFCTYLYIILYIKVDTKSWTISNCTNTIWIATKTCQSSNPIPLETTPSSVQLYICVPFPNSYAWQSGLGTARLPRLGYTLSSVEFTYLYFFSFVLSFYEIEAYLKHIM